MVHVRLHTPTPLINVHLFFQVNLREVMDDVRKHYSKADRSLLGFFGCLTYLKNGYRWGALPAVQEERQRQTLVFPQIIDQPMVEVGVSRCFFTSRSFQRAHSDLRLVNFLQNY